MSYSNSVATWISGVSTAAGVKKGWKGSVWTAVNTTLTEPAADNTNWSLDTPIKLEGISVIEFHDPKNFLKIRVSGIALVETHVSRPPEVLLSSINLMKFRPEPYFNVV